jgi:hypothetical protein
MQRQRQRVMVVASVAVLMATVVACGGDGDDPPAPETAGPTGSPAAPAPSLSPAPPAHDPPLAFAETGVRIGRPDSGYAIHDGTAYFVTEDEPADGEDSLIAAELATGVQRWSRPVAGTVVLGDWATPAVADVDTGPVVFMPLVVERPGSGTTPGRELVRVTAFDGVTGSPVWSTDLDDTDVPGISGYSNLSVSADQDQVAVSVEYLADGDAYTAYTAVLDAGTGDARWLEAGFLATALDDQTVVGNTATREPLSLVYTLEGRSASDGDRLWSIDEPEDIRDIRGLGSGLGYYVGVPSGESTTYLVELRTGEVLVSFDGGSECRHDGESIVVCATVDFYTFDDYLVAYDVRAGERLWELPDEAADRIAPSSLVAARPGAVYANTDNGPLIIDARTGEDLVTDLPFAVERVVPGFGLRRDDRLALWAHPATG